MFFQNITFSAPKNYLNNTKDYPKPIKLNIPHWFKDLEHTKNNFTVKGCVPFLETLKTGYVLSLPQDFILQYDSLGEMNFQPSQESNSQLPLNKRGTHHIHSIKQFEGSPIQKTNLNFSVNKIINPWIIKTPPGYSCLFMSPLNNTDDRFSIISGIVNTDTYDQPINFPFNINGDKYPNQDTILKKGTPYVQIVPFKRDSWKMKINSYNTEKLDLDIYNFFLKIYHKYKNKFWTKTIWK